MHKQNTVRSINNFRLFLKSHSYTKYDDECIYRFDQANQLLFIVGIENERKTKVFFECIPLVSLSFFETNGAPQGGCWSTLHIMVKNRKSFQNTSLEEQLSFFCHHIFPSLHALSSTGAVLNFNKKMSTWLNLTSVNGSPKTTFAYLSVNRVDEAIQYCNHNIQHFTSILASSPNSNHTRMKACIDSFSKIKSILMDHPTYFNREIENTIIQNEKHLITYLEKCKDL